MAKSLIDISKHEKKLRAIVALSNAGATVFTEKTSEAIQMEVTKSEFIDAFKYDIDKTARFLVESLPIINSIKNGIVQEIKSSDNAVEDFFGNSYSNGILTLCGTEFELNKNIDFSKGDIVDFIYENEFNIKRKELAVLSKTLKRFDSTKSDIEKAVLYPSTILADKLLKKIGVIDKNFSDYRNKLSYEEKVDFSITFKRSGVTDVIQKSTYIDLKGIRQTSSSHKKNIDTLNKISEGILNNEFKYIEAIEIDGDGDIDKALLVLNQIKRLKINCENKLTLKFRKLGNLKAKGIFFTTSLIVAEDVRDTSALIHEIAHFIHLGNKNIFNSPFVDYMIDKLKKRIDFSNLNISDEAKLPIISKKKYYTDDKEVIARALEIAAMFANQSGRVMFGSNDLDMILSDEYYNGHEGIYFNFNSFDDETKKEMLSLWKLFYETSYGEPEDTNINNFIKIDTEYRKTRKIKSLRKIIEEEHRKSRKEKKELYSMVSSENIEIIIENRPMDLDIRVLSTVLLGNISYWGNHKDRCIVEEWGRIREFKSDIVLKLLEEVNKDTDDNEYLAFLIELESEKILRNAKVYVSADGFSRDSFRASFVKHMKTVYPDGRYHTLRDWFGLTTKTVMVLATEEQLNNKELLENYTLSNPIRARNLENLEKISQESIMLVGYTILEIEDKRSFIPPTCFKDEKFCFDFLKSSNNKINEFSFIPEEFRNSKKFMNKVLPLYEDDILHKVFIFVGKDLLGDLEFSNYWLAKNDLIEDILIEANIEAPKKATPKKATPKKEVVETTISSKDSFKSIIKNGDIEEFIHTKTGEILKVLKIEEKLEDFKSFNKYLIEEKIGYYSKYAKGFVINDISKIESTTYAATNATTTGYDSDLLNKFAGGTLF